MPLLRIVCRQLDADRSPQWYGVLLDHHSAYMLTVGGRPAIHRGREIILVTREVLAAFEGHADGNDLIAVVEVPVTAHGDHIQTVPTRTDLDNLDHLSEYTEPPRVEPDQLARAAGVK